MIQSKREEIDDIMQSFEIPEMKDIKYISFKNTILDDKVGALHLNNMNNGKVRFEILHNTNIFKELTYEEKISMIRDILLSIKCNKA